MNLVADIFSYIIEIFFLVSGDYGIAIVLITLLIRLALLPLNMKQRQQMGHQQETAQKAEAIKAKYKNHQSKQEEELQKLYQESRTGMGSCLLALIQVPVMYCLYNAIRTNAALDVSTVLLPWVSSLLVRDRSFLLPVATLLVQILPQLYPYMKCFEALKLQKASISLILTMLLANGMFVFVIPSGIGLYYFISGLFSAVEQFAVHRTTVKKLSITV